MSVPDGFKATEVGVIPEDWEAKPLSSLKPFITSGSRGWAKYYAEAGDAFVRITNLSRQNIYPDLSDLRRVRLPEGENEGTRTGLRNGDVLVSITADIGIIGFVDDRVPKPAYINQHIAIVRVDQSEANSKFLSYFLATEGSQRRVRATTDAGAKAGMSLTGVGNLLAAFSLHFVLLMAAAPLPKLLFDHFVAQLESFLFYYIFTKTPTRDLERSFSLWADELRAIAVTVDASVQQEDLNGFIAGRFQTSMADKTQELSDALKRYSLYSMQQYRTRYLLARLTQYVDLAFSGVKTPGSLDPYVVLEIEHILPDTPTSELRAAWAAENPDSPYDDYKNRLGNLTLLEKPINIVASNDFYAEKQKEYRKSSNYLTRSLVELTEVGQNTSISRINEKLASFPTWDAAAIDKRHELLMALAVEIWKTSPFEI